MVGIRYGRVGIRQGYGKDRVGIRYGMVGVCQGQGRHRLVLGEVQGQAGPAEFLVLALALVPGWLGWLGCFCGKTKWQVWLGPLGHSQGVLRALNCLKALLAQPWPCYGLAMASCLPRCGLRWSDLLFEGQDLVPRILWFRPSWWSEGGENTELSIIFGW